MRPRSSQNHRWGRAQLSAGSWTNTDMFPPSSKELIRVRLEEWARRFDARLAELVGPPGQVAGGEAGSALGEAVRYAVLGPGKRLRPYLLCRSHALCGGDEEVALPIAAAIECAHAFSLVHDDLPALDDDDLRRGRPTVHLRFGEALAILAGDALLSLAFELIAEHAPDGRRARELTLELARAVGTGGMIGGQAADIGGERLPPDRALVERIQVAKTARLFEAACRLGAVLADSDLECQGALARYGAELGVAFQITDDILDAAPGRQRPGEAVSTQRSAVSLDVAPGGERLRESDRRITAAARPEAIPRGERPGDEAGKEAEARKQTLVRCVGIEESRQAAAIHVERAIEALGGARLPLTPPGVVGRPAGTFGAEADDLRELARFVLERTR